MKSDYYLNFENQFRGESTSINEQFSKYLELIKLSLDVNESSKLLDIGSGRGEWLQICKQVVHECIGIENDSHMVQLCRKKGLNILEDDAILALNKISSNSISIITAFHIIEHMEHKTIINLLSECYRVLNSKGILIIETPSIDNLVVSANNFYVDPTHITHINSDALIFDIRNVGFSDVKEFNIHGGPLQNDKHSKITRVFNGIAQDLLVIAVKNIDMSKLVFQKDTKWMSNLDLSQKFLEAAIDFDLRNEEINTVLFSEIKSLKTEVRNLKYELVSMKSQMNTKTILKNKIHFKFTYPKRLIKKQVYDNSKRILNKIINLSPIRSIILSRNGLQFIGFMVNNFPILIPSSLALKINSRLKKLQRNDFKSEESNKFLSSYYSTSKKAKIISKSIIDDLNTTIS